MNLQEAVYDRPGRFMNGNFGFRWEYPANTYRCLSIPSVSYMGGNWDDFFINENGVAFTASVTGYASDEAYQADPTIPDGIREECMATIVGPMARTAREAVELLAGLIDRYGHIDSDIVMVADRKEAWYMEIYTGHQYCAVRMPDDAVAVFGNEFMLDTVDPDSDDVICSKELFSLPRKHGFAVMDANGRMNLRRTYSGDGRLYDPCHMRTWRGHQLLSPSTSHEYDRSEYYPFFFKPDFKVDLATVRQLYRDRYEGTAFNPEETGSTTTRVIGYETQSEVHILEVFDNVPKEMTCVAWVCMSEAAHAPFIPFTVNATHMNEHYAYDAPVAGYDTNSAFILYKRVNAICSMNRKIFSEKVKFHWAKSEQDIEDNFREAYSRATAIYASSPDKAAEILIDFEVKAQDDCIRDAKRIFEEMCLYLMSYSQTYPYGYVLTNHPELKDFPEFKLSRVASE